MLETKNLTKIYKPKKGVPGKPTNNLSIKFPDTGMVFLLGKSGSGKSTLLNLLGGLDRYNSGEIIIKGVSSKSFKQRHFDSYRNTYVGFIFQEYNILEEFSVGANIALAIELQGRKASNTEINQILKEVDLEGFGNRRPSELSGGQKQRVAIARALVKNPKIIMADEPSGALDSETGKQVFETLKKLSKEKLVIVVSHDRDFASKYADRIVELSDGSIISDTTAALGETNESGLTFNKNTVKITKDYRLTEADRIAINEYLERLENGLDLTFENSSAQKSFVSTNQEEITSLDTEPFKLIKSKLSLRHAFKIGSGGLKHKKVRLVFTIILSCVAFVLFGLADTFGAYNHIKTCTESIIDSGIDYAAVTKDVLLEEDYWDTVKLTDTDLEKITAETNINFTPVVSADYDISFLNNVFDYKELYEKNFYNIYSGSFAGAVEITEQQLKNLGFKIAAGKLPEKGKNQIAISAYIAETFKVYGFAPNGNASVIANGNAKKKEIKSYSDLIGQKLTLEFGEYEIAAVIDTNFNFDRYEFLTKIDENSSTEDAILGYALYSELSSEQQYSYAGLIMLPKGGLNGFNETLNRFKSTNQQYIYFENDENMLDTYYFATLDKVNPKDIVWLGSPKTALGEKEIILSRDMIGLEEIYNENGFIEFDTSKARSIAEKEFKLNHYNYVSGENKTVEGYHIVGIYDNYNANVAVTSAAIVSTSFFNEYFPKEGDYNFLLGAMPKDESGVKTLVNYCYNQGDNTSYPLNNAVCFELDALNSSLNVLAKVFLYIGLFFALFAAILLSNFIATSISYKKQEIGILRAIGSRSNDVFRIFFAESFIIAMINFVLSAIGVFVITVLINMVIRTELGLLLTVFNFGIRQIVLIFAVSVFAAFISSFLPVKKIASMRPIDAIKNR